MPHASDAFPKLGEFSNTNSLEAAVVAENGGEGSTVAAPVARDIMRTYFENKK